HTPHPFPTRRSADLKATIDYINDMILTNVDGVRPGKVQELKTAIAEAYQVYLQSDDANEIKAAISNLCEKAQELWLIVSKAELKDRKSTRLNSSHVS